MSEQKIIEGLNVSTEEALLISGFIGKPFPLHVTWNDLMPVVEKINRMGKMVTINLWTEINCTECKIYNWELGAPHQEAENANALEAIWLCVVDFIKWYNQLNQQEK